MKSVIADRKAIAEGTMWVRFEYPEEISFKPGQFFFVTLPSLLFDDRRGPTRHFSIVNSPAENKTIEMTTRLRNSGFKQTLSKLDLGTKVEIKDIQGDFVLPSSDKPLVFMAGGIGITPFMSMIRFIRDRKLFDYKITLIYTSKDRASTPFLDELQVIFNKNFNCKLVLTMTKDANWMGEKRRIDGKFLKDYLADFDRSLYMIAGPPGFVSGMGDVLEDLKIDKDNIRTERFSGY
ncbi:FAD-dependent oxidoreductase [Patescibacteria group bacterium]|nr:FAD-dependent oxidoreductase [Patescibacteria group bacterium]